MERREWLPLVSNSHKEDAKKEEKCASAEPPPTACSHLEARAAWSSEIGKESPIGECMD